MGIGGWIFLAVVAALVIWMIATYNGLVTVRNRFRNAFSQIDVQLKRRYDLIPNLVETAMNGTDALTAVLRGRPDVVLLDINMPRMNGVEVLKDIKKIDESIPVIMVTANEQISLAADALKTGAFGYVPKPFDFRYLDHMVAAIFDRPRPKH